MVLITYGRVTTTMPEIFTDEDMVNALLELSKRPIIIMAKSSTKMRGKSLKAWREKQRELKAVKTDLSARLSARMKIWWAKRKAQRAN